MKDEVVEIWQDPAKEIGELVFDKTVQDIAPILAEIPMLSVVMAAAKTGKAWSDFLLAKKVQRFYTAWEVLPKTERQEIFEKFQKKPKAFTEKLLFMLAQQEDLQKCRLLGDLTVRYLKGEIRRGDFLDLVETVGQLTLGDLVQLGRLLTHDSLILPRRIIGERFAVLFVGRGLLTQRTTSGDSKYQLTKLGQTLAECARGIKW